MVAYKRLSRLNSWLQARKLAWFIAGLYAILMGASLALMLAVSSPIVGVSWSELFLEAAVLSVWVVVGALILSRHPRHPVGWLWSSLPIPVALDNVAWGYTYYGTITHPGSLPGVELTLVWLYALFGRQTLGPFGIMLLLLLFPTGRLPSPRWRVLVWVAVAAVAINITASVLAPNPIGYFPFPKDLFTVSDATRAVLEPLRVISITGLLLCILAAIFSLFIRLTRSGGEERQQLKWFVYSISIFALGFLLTTIGGARQEPGLNSAFLSGALLVLLGFAGASVASAIAILRYKLWDIDFIIRRSLVYSALTLTLAVIYFSGVTVFQALFTAISHQKSEISNVISTLLIAALFTPLLRRIQNDIDRRFYRQKYNAEKTLAAFSANLRQEVDLDELSSHLLGIVQGTFQPEQASIWLKKSKKY
jgi:hypothetical protein